LLLYRSPKAKRFVWPKTINSTNQKYLWKVFSDCRGINKLFFERYPLKLPADITRQFEDLLSQETTQGVKPDNQETVESENSLDNLDFYPDETLLFHPTFDPEFEDQEFRDELI
jgi:hypothetical protein